MLGALVSIWLGFGTGSRHLAICAEPAAGATTATPSSGTTDAVLERRLRDEAPKAWTELEQFYRHTRGSFSMSTVYSPNKIAAARSERGEFALNGDLVKEVDVVQKKGVSLERVMAKNDLYAFSIARRDGDPHARFAIEGLEKLGADANLDDRVAFHTGQTEAVLFWPWRINGRSLPDWVKTPPFVIKGVAPVRSGATATVRVDFEGMRVGPDAHPVTLSGYVVFDPSDHWVVRQCFTRWPEGEARDAVFEYARHEDGFPILTKRVEKGGTEKQHFDYTELLDLRHETVPADEFRLSHYGLPEPDFREPGRRSLLWLLASVGLGCVLIGCLIWSRKYRAGVAK
jgi:hypothetical protein